MSVVWGGWVTVNLGIGEFYHPMSARGDLLRPLRQGAIVGPILTAIAMFMLWLWCRPLATRTYLIGLFALAVSALLSQVPLIDSGYRQVYWLGEDRYEIPWRYGPFNGSPKRGGKFFLVKVSVPEMAPEYDRRGETIIIGKAVDFEYGEGGEAPEELCTEDFSQWRCQLQRGESVYVASGREDDFPPDVADLMVSAADLLDSFEVSAEPRGN